MAPLRHYVAAALVAFPGVIHAQTEGTYERLQREALGELHVEGDEFDSNYRVVGQGFFIKPGGVSIANLQTSVPKSGGAVKYILKVFTSYRGGWQYWERATVRGGKPLYLQVINREVSGCYSFGCSYIENFAILVPEAYLRRAGADFSLKLASRNGGSLVLTVPQERIGEVLATSDSVRTSLRRK